MKKIKKTNRKKFLCSLSLLVLSLFLLTGCAREVNATTKSVLAAIISAYTDLPDIRICHSDAAEFDEYYLDGDLLLSLFEKNGEVPEFDSIEECAIFIAKGQQIAELGVFKAYTFAFTKNVEQMCQRRLDIIEKSNSGSTGEIITIGKYVIYIILPDNQTAKNICRQMLS